MVKQSFVLEKADAMPVGLLEQMLAFIKTNVPAGAMQQLLFKSKFIITELLTNSIKHAGAGNTEMLIEADSAFVRFTKTDYGKRLTLTGVEQQQANALTVTADIMHVLYAVKKDKLLYFYCEEKPEPLTNLDHDFPEHFGLLIITKASNEFFYQYNAESGSNVFTATVKF